MFSVGERSFHLSMLAMLIAALLLDNFIPDFLPDWRAPEVGILTFVIGLVWIGRYTAWRAELQDERTRVIEDRIARLDRLQRGLEDEVLRAGASDEAVAVVAVGDGHFERGKLVLRCTRRRDREENEQGKVSQTHGALEQARGTVTIQV